MKKTTDHRRRDDARPEYDFASMKGGVRGKYYEQYRNGTNVVLLDPDVSEAFPTEVAVNEALRGILTMTRAVRRTGGLLERTANSGGAQKRRKPRK
jgi:hypothetical protein